MKTAKANDGFRNGTYIVLSTDRYFFRFIIGTTGQRDAYATGGHVPV